ncbi:MAG TPA: DUF1003 domain-containing protein [Flavobacterium sp.]|jgi:uncharacterized membrane protein
MKTKKKHKHQMAKVVERNINVLLERRRAEDERKSTEEKVADKITRFTGSMLFVYIHLVLFGTWILWNTGVLGLEPFDPSFVVLAMEASVEAIFLSTFVLISQNRMNVQADKRAELDLQISLLTEHEVTRLITIVKQLADKLEVQIPDDVDLDDLAKDVLPEKVMDTMEAVKKEKTEENPKKNPPSV